VLNFDELGAISGDPLAGVIRSLVKYVNVTLSFIMSDAFSSLISTRNP